MVKVKAYDDRALSKSTRAAASIAGIALIALSAFSSVKYSAVIGVVLLLAVIFGKETYATEEGISMEYDFLVFKHVIHWDFEEITDIHLEGIRGGHQGMHFLRDVMTRRLLFSREEVEQVLQMAKSRNGAIHVEKID
ncbi:hypothetical protein [Emergencia sp.]|uniref:hypothetical protein n=1 Tax=Emergencia sp. TaxID=1926557 RepID=UPI003AF1A1B0